MHGSMDRNDCIIDAGCQSRYSNWSWSRRRHLHDHLRANEDDISDAMHELEGEIGNELSTAAHANMGNVQQVGQDWANQAATILTNYGCDGDCMNQCATHWTTFDQCEMRCNCPAVITFNGPEGHSVGIPPIF